MTLMELGIAWRMLWTIVLFSALAGLAIAKHAYVFDELAWTKQSWSDMKLRFPIETVLNDDEFGSYEHLSSKGTHSKASFQQALEEGMSHTRWAFQIHGRTYTLRSCLCAHKASCRPYDC